MKIGDCKHCKTDTMVAHDSGWGSYVKCSTCHQRNCQLRKMEDLPLADGGESCDLCGEQMEPANLRPCYCAATHAPCSACEDSGWKCEPCDTYFTADGEETTYGRGMEWD